MPERETQEREPASLIRANAENSGSRFAFQNGFGNGIERSLFRAFPGGFAIIRAIGGNGRNGRKAALKALPGVRLGVIQFPLGNGLNGRAIFGLHPWIWLP